jgi:hypothetical protein
VGKNLIGKRVKRKGKKSFYFYYFLFHEKQFLYSETIDIMLKLTKTDSVFLNIDLIEITGGEGRGWTSEEINHDFFC